jgi:hypothetical protein
MFVSGEVFNPLCHFAFLSFNHFATPFRNGFAYHNTLAASANECQIIN